MAWEEGGGRGGAVVVTISVLVLMVSMKGWMQSLMSLGSCEVGRGGLNSHL